MYYSRSESFYGKSKSQKVERENRVEFPENMNRLVTHISNYLGDYNPNTESIHNQNISANDDNLNYYESEFARKQTNTFKAENGAWYYEGGVEEGYKNGIGKQMFDDGSLYIGIFQNNKLNGDGRMVNSDGSVFQGTFVDNNAK